MNYDESFSPVVRFSSIRLILSLVAHMDLELFQMDVKAGFLNDDLNYEIYMHKLIGFITPDKKIKYVN